VSSFESCVPWRGCPRDRNGKGKETTKGQLLGEWAKGEGIRELDVAGVVLFGGKGQERVKKRTVTKRAAVGTVKEKGRTRMRLNLRLSQLHRNPCRRSLQKTRSLGSVRLSNKEQGICEKSARQATPSESPGRGNPEDGRRTSTASLHWGKGSKKSRSCVTFNFTQKNLREGGASDEKEKASLEKGGAK